MTTKTKIKFGQLGVKSKPFFKTVRVNLKDGKQTTLKQVFIKRRALFPRLVSFDKLTRLEPWCRKNNVMYAVNGGFYGTEMNSIKKGDQAGELWIEGDKLAETESGFERGCLHVSTEGILSIDRRGLFPQDISGSLLEAGPLLVKEGVSLLEGVSDPEGFSAEAAKFDGDIIVGRHPRAAIATNEEFIVLVAAEGRKSAEAGLSLLEMAEYLKNIGMNDALNLDGGSAVSLIYEGRLQNKPGMDRDQGYKKFPHGRPIKTAIIFT